MQNCNYGNRMMSSTVSVMVMSCRTVTMLTELCLRQYLLGYVMQNCYYGNRMMSLTVSARICHAEVLLWLQNDVFDSIC